MSYPLINEANISNKVTKDGDVGELSIGTTNNTDFKLFANGEDKIILDSDLNLIRLPGLTESVNATGLVAINPSDGSLYLKPLSNTVTPPGTIIWQAGSTTPTGYLKANGATLSRAVYSGLFAAIGTIYGSGDGSTTFAIPDLRGELVRGWDDGRGIDTGRGMGSSQLDQMQRITGSVDFLRADGVIIGIGSGYQGAMLNPGSITNSIPTGTAGTSKGYGVLFDSGSSPNARTSADTSGETRPRNIALLACIKF